MIDILKNCPLDYMPVFSHPHYNNDTNSLPVSFQQRRTNTGCSPCGSNAGAPIRTWCTTCACESAAHWSPGGRKPWLKLSSPCWRRGCHSLRPRGSTTYRTQRSYSTPTAFTTCLAPALTGEQVRASHVSDIWNFTFECHLFCRSDG